MPVVTTERHDRSGCAPAVFRRTEAAELASAGRSLLPIVRQRPGNRHAELLILCARIGFNP
jgi:hypothetical protein